MRVLFSINKHEHIEGKILLHIDDRLILAVKNIDELYDLSDIILTIISEIKENYNSEEYI